jgi:gliding motility-associated-like protein
MKNFRCLILLFLLIFSQKNFATHIVGGEIFYNYLGSNTYRITLKLYRDCLTGLAPYDDPATIFIFDNSGNFVDSISIPFPGSAILPPTINNPCFTPPTNICVEEAIYQANVVLPPLAGGYNLDYQRCCRNNSILNIISPGDVGSTYMAHIPSPSLAANNSSPHYVNFPPIFICSGVPLTFDHSAADADGDSLHYELCDPFTGLDGTCPILGTQAGTNCPIIGSPPPFASVPWQSPYNASYPLSSSPGLSINPNTGLITGTPNMVGQWVVGVCVSEYRNGILLDVNKRDFQFNVVNCPNLPVATLTQQTQFCTGFNVNFTQTSLNASSYHWDFGVPNVTNDTSNLSSTSWTYADTGVYTVTLIINQGTACADTSIGTFAIYPLLTPTFTAPAGQCIYNNSFNFTIGGTFSGTGTHVWDFTSAATPDSSNQISVSNVIYDSAGVYPVTFTISEGGCTKVLTDSVHVYPKPIAHFGMSNDVGCALHPVVFLDSSISSSPLNYQWNFGNGTTSTSGSPLVTYSTPGQYTVSLIITSADGCKDSFQLAAPLVVESSPIAGFTVSPTETSIFYPDVTITDESSFATGCETFWGDGGHSNTCDSVHTYTLPGNYIVRQVVVNALGCHDTASANVLIYPEFLCWIPNTFTPDNNGLNDDFKPKIIGAHDYTFLIFDRWGNKLFETNEIDKGWNGYYKGRLCENAVYTYKINLRDDVQNKVHQYIGMVVLLKLEY